MMDSPRTNTSTKPPLKPIVNIFTDLHSSSREFERPGMRIEHSVT